MKNNITDISILAMKLNTCEHQMVRTARKFVVSPLRAVVLGGTALILLSVPAVESLRCYWCGPLAEQVHRSRRAPPCGAPGDHTTTCEPDLGHCAVVATAPPYVESRYCVKLYQDECYSLFCNTTRTWRMTCPCRGDLCNGPNTDRETEAFNVLKTLAEKTRLRKRAISSDKVVDPDDESSDIPNNMTSSTMIWNESSRNNIEDSYNDQETKLTEISETQSIINASIVSKDEKTDDEQNNEIESNPNNPDVKSDSNEMQSDAPVEDPKNVNGNNKIEETEKSNPNNDITTSTENPNTESILSTVKTVGENQKDEKTETPTNQPKLLEGKPTGVLPTAEALQQKESTTVDIEKNTNLPTTGKTDSISTLPNIEVTLVPSIPSKNAGNYISVSLILLTYCTTLSM